MELLTTLLYIVFVFSAIALVVVILLQEGKGGGFGDALGVAGQQTFGVKASGIHKFTGALCVVFFVCAVAITVFNRTQSESSSIGDDTSLFDTPAPESGE
ncbi:MAG: preprotein translocase subunit SecG [Planctomycetota bacterium]|nr:preprotein translocase subunit SecG [Planctomycetota bacterium]